MDIFDDNKATRLIPKNKTPSFHVCIHRAVIYLNTFGRHIIQLYSAHQLFCLHDNSNCAKILFFIIIITA